MERKKGRLKSFILNPNEKEKLSSKETINVFMNQEIDKCNLKYQNQNGDWEQSCICDPAFTIHDSSSSNSVDSCTSSECLLKNTLKNENSDLTANLNTTTTESDERTNGFILPKFISTKEIKYSDKLTKRESELHCSIIDPSVGFTDNMIRLDQPSDELDEPNDDNRNTCSFVNTPYINKFQIYKSGVEPYFADKLLKGPQPKLYVGGSEKCYSDLTNLSDYITESDSSIYNEESSSKHVKSILKTRVAMQVGDHPKKKVRFNLNRDVQVSEITKKKTSPPTGTINCISSTSSEIKMDTTDINDQHQLLKDQSHKLKENKNILHDKCKECNGPLQSQSNFTYNEKSIRSPSVSESMEDVLYNDRYASNIDEMQIENRKLDLKRSYNSDESILDNMNPRQENSNQLFNTSNIQFDVQKKKINGNVGLEGNSKPYKLTKDAHTGPDIITEDEYSYFIKDLFTGSGDRLAKFLVCLSSEIAKKSSSEKLKNALMTVDMEQEEYGKKVQLKSVSKDSITNTKSSDERKTDFHNYKNIRSHSPCSTNENLIKNTNRRGYFVKARRSMSEISINQLNSRIPYYRGYMENKFHTSSVNKLYINKRHTESPWEGHSHTIKDNNSNDTMGKLHELMAELKDSIEKLSKKESTIRIENAQIWLKESKSIDQFLYDIEKRSATNLSEKSNSPMQIRKEMYSQTAETKDMPLSDKSKIDNKKRVGSKTEILIVSNAKNEEINIQLNEKKSEARDSVLSVEPSPSVSNALMSNLKEVSEDEEKRSLLDDLNTPFSLVFDDKKQIPILKNGKCEFEVFEKVDEPIIQEKSLKNMLDKISEQINILKLNGLHSQRYEKPPIFRQMHSSKHKLPQNRMEGKASGNLLQTFLNRFLKPKTNINLKQRQRVQMNLKHPMQSKSQISYFKSLIPAYSNENNCSYDHVGYRMMPENFDVYDSQFTSNCVSCENNCIAISDDEQWPDIVKTKYPNGMVHYGPLSLMPEPDSALNLDRQGMEWENCFCPCFQEYQYTYNKNTVEASITRTLNAQPETHMCLEEINEMAQILSGVK